jgi:hypothetical protein
LTLPYIKVPNHPLSEAISTVLRVCAEEKMVLVVSDECSNGRFKLKLSQEPVLQGVEYYKPILSVWFRE